jgi:hypothetical protein
MSSQTVAIETPRPLGPNRDQLLRSVARTIQDYRRGEIPTPTAEHVDRWIGQFDDADQITILSEIDRILARHYISRQRAERLMQRVLIAPAIWGSAASDRASHAMFLRIQRKGTSQADLLKLVQLDGSIEIRPAENSSGRPVDYVYVDDSIFTGYTAWHDIRSWYRPLPPGAFLHLVFFAAYEEGRWSLRQKLKSLTGQDGVRVRFWCRLLYGFKLPQRLWPEEEPGNQAALSYSQQVQDTARRKGTKPRLFRIHPPTRPDPFFSSPQARSIVERAFLRAGLYIVAQPRASKVGMRPMGYEVAESLGFGAMFVTYRNIANTCPLALWWGDPRAPSTHPFSKWYPLLPRRSNEQTRYQRGLDAGRLTR